VRIGAHESVALGLWQAFARAEAHGSHLVNLASELPVQRVAQALDDVHAATAGFTARVCVEVTAGQGNTLGWRLEHLEELLQRTRDAHRLSFCLDTCHLHAAGYELATAAGCAAVLEEAERRLGMHRVACLHLNDCKGPRGCRVDRHEEIGKGTIGLEAFRLLMREPRLAATVGVLETPIPERYGESIRLLQSLAGE
jgi:deoxyribonuclease IV